MRGRTALVPGVGLVSYVPGRSYGRLYVASGSYSPVRVPENPGFYPRGSVEKRLNRAGSAAMGALLGFCLVADGAALWGIAWLIR
jgi:hypothetical protein